MLSKLRNAESGQDYARKWCETHTGLVQHAEESNRAHIERMIAELRTLKHSQPCLRMGCREQEGEEEYGDTIQTFTRLPKKQGCRLAYTEGSLNRS